jgi:ABC-type sugar transport system permease subunit
MKAKSILFVLPAFIIYTVLLIIPMLIVFVLSFTDWDGISPAFKFIGTGNFLQLLQDGRFVSSISVTGVITVIVVLAVNIFGLLFALMLVKSKGSTNLFRSIFFIPVLLSSVAISFSWNALLSYSGVINTVLGAFGIGAQDFYSTKSSALACIIIVEIWRNMGFFMTIYIASLQTVPQELYEACTMDGGNSWHRFKNITIPMIVPGITICTIFSIMTEIKLFDTPMILTGGGPGFNTETIVLTIFKRSLQSNQMSYGASMAFVLFIAISLISLFQLKISKRFEVEN